MAEPIRAKQILGRVKNDPYFGFMYNMNLYRGCQHGCIYCDSRSTCYQLGDLRHIRYKENAIELLNKELQGKRKRGTIGFGSMNDPYMPAEKDFQLTRKALEVIYRYRFPVHILTKSDLVCRDVDVLKDISKVYSAVSFTITTADNKLAKVLEPGAPDSGNRFKALATLRKQGIYAGINLMPVLPFINDTAENLTELLKMAVDAGAEYVLPFFGLTLREGSRDYFYKALETHFPNLKSVYEKQFGTSYICNSLNSNNLYKIFYETINKQGIKSRMDFYKPDTPQQLSLF